MLLLQSIMPVMSSAERGDENATGPEAREAAAERAPTPWGGFRIQLPDFDAELRFRGLVQTDAVLFAGDTQAPPRFEIRRARIALAGNIGEVFAFRIEPQLTPGGLDLLDAYLDARLVGDALVLRAGKMKTPLGLEMLQTVSAMRLPERGPSAALVPNRDLGLQVFGELGGGVFSYAASLGSGARDGGRGDEAVDGHFDVYARAFLHPFYTTSIAPLQKLGIGVAGSWGEAYGDDEQSGLASYRTGTRATFARYTEGAHADGQRWRLNPQLYAYFGPFGMLGEYVFSSQRVRGEGDAHTVDNHAWTLGASYAITQEAASFGALTPRHDWGAFEMAARYGELYFDPDAFAHGFLTDVPRVVRAWAIGLNYWAAAVVRIQLAFEQTMFETARGVTTISPENAIYLRVHAGI